MGQVVAGATHETGQIVHRRDHLQPGKGQCYNATMVFVIIQLLQTDGPIQVTSVRIILALVCVIVASSMALGVAVGLSRRIQTIADQRPVDDPAQQNTDPPAAHEPDGSGES